MSREWVLETATQLYELQRLNFQHDTLVIVEQSILWEQSKAKQNPNL